MNYRALYDEAFKGKYNPIEDRIEYKYAKLFLKDHPEFKTHLDIGTGRGGLLCFLDDFKLKSISLDLQKYHSLAIDHVDVDLSVQEDLDKLDGMKFDWVTSMGTLEHLEARYLSAIFLKIKSICHYASISIANHPDGDYHLTIKDEEWWLKGIRDIMPVINSMTFNSNRIVYFDLKGALE
jgi:2-polyprenyl-3-methyl-5-hydroxy-6-metoxy-1,4-benzoquinol methylase